MPKTQMNDLRKMKVEELIKLGEDKRAELFALKFQAVLGSLEKTHQIKETKKEIARIELVLGEMKKAGQDTNKTVKGDYTNAVKEADKAGKAVREKQMKMVEEMQKQQFGGATTTAEAKPEEADAKATDSKEEAKPAAKPAAKKASTAKKPAAKTTTKTTTTKGETK